MGNHLDQMTCPQCKSPVLPVAAIRGEVRYCESCALPLVVVAGKYQIERLLSEGGGGVLYLARHQRLNLEPIRVIKFLRPELFKNEKAKQRFAYEVEITSAISQRNDHIVRIYDDFGNKPGLGHYYVMEYLEGESLEELLEREPDLPFPLICHIFRQLCFAIREAHHAEVVHRDLKPSNVFLIERRGDPHFVKVLDFGIAKVYTAKQDAGRTQGAIGTPEYMSPEQCTARDVDHRSDIYSMGVLLYELLVGQTPFAIPEGDEANLLTILVSQLSAPVPPPTTVRPERNIPDGLEKIVLRALEKQPAHRFQSVDEMLAALDSVERLLHTRDTFSSTSLPASAVSLPTGTSLPAANAGPSTFQYGGEKETPAHGFLAEDELSGPTLFQVEGVPSSVVADYSIHAVNEGQMRVVEVSSIPTPVIEDSGDWAEDDQTELQTFSPNDSQVGLSGSFTEEAPYQQHRRSGKTGGHVWKWIFGLLVLLCLGFVALWFQWLAPWIGKPVWFEHVREQIQGDETVQPAPHSRPLKAKVRERTTEVPVPEKPIETLPTPRLKEERKASKQSKTSKKRAVKRREHSKEKKKRRLEQPEQRKNPKVGSRESRRAGKVGRSKKSLTSLRKPLTTPKAVARKVAKRTPLPRRHSGRTAGCPKDSEKGMWHLLQVSPRVAPKGGFSDVISNRNGYCVLRRRGSRASVSFVRRGYASCLFVPQGRYVRVVLKKEAKSQLDGLDADKDYCIY